MLTLSSLPFLLAAVPADTGVDRYQSTANFREMLIIFGAVTLVTVLLLVWAVSLRKPRRRHGSHRAKEEPANLVRYRQEQHEDTGLLSLLKPKRRRRKRRWHHRNPTLAETGGLPPIRSDSNSAPPSLHP